MNNIESEFGDCVGNAVLFLAALCFPFLLLCLGILVIGAVVVSGKIGNGAQTSRGSRHSCARTNPWLIADDNSSVAWSGGRVGPS